MCDLFLMYSAPALLNGRCCDDSETLCFVSICANLTGWLLYMAYALPIYFNVFMWSLTYVQFIRLLFVDDDHVASFWNYLVRRPNPRRA